MNEFHPMDATKVFRQLDRRKANRPAAEDLQHAVSHAKTAGRLIIRATRKKLRMMNP
jgi:hypothetical protein